LISRCFAWRSKPPFRAQGGRPAFDHVLMFKVLILQAMHALSDERTEFLIKDRLSFMRFLGLGLADTVPDANTIWTFREALKKADAIDGLFRRFDEALRSEGFLAMSGQIVDATIVATPKQRNTIEEKKAIKEGHIPADWKDKPAKLAQKDRDARWTVKYSKAKPREDGSVPAVDLAIPAFGYKNHVSIDRGFGLIRNWTTTHAAAHEGARLEDVLDRTNTASDVWADTGRRRTKRCSRAAGSCRASIARSGRAGRCPSACVSPTRRNPKSAAWSSTCSRIRKDRWASSCARSA
jgi:IS5 family transposase